MLCALPSIDVDVCCITVYLATGAGREPRSFPRSIVHICVNSIVCVCVCVRVSVRIRILILL